jgi:hypothetical protein
MSSSNFSHLVGIDEAARLLRIHRVFPDGRRHSFTETPLPTDPKSPKCTEFARVLGEGILPDSPTARRILGT